MSLIGLDMFREFLQLFFGQWDQNLQTFALLHLMHLMWACSFLPIWQAVGRSNHLLLFGLKHVRLSKRDYKLFS